MPQAWAGAERGTGRADERTQLLSLLEKVAASVALAPGAHAALRDDVEAAAHDRRDS